MNQTHLFSNNSTISTLNLTTSLRDSTLATIILGFISALIFIAHQAWRSLSSYEKDEFKRRIILAAFFSVMGVIFLCGSIGSLLSFLRSANTNDEDDILVGKFTEAQDIVGTKPSAWMYGGGIWNFLGFVGVFFLFFFVRK